MQFKYAVDLGRYESCPPASIVPHQGHVFRFVHQNVADPRNFLVLSKLDPNRLEKLPLAVRCDSFALSLFSARDKAIEFFGKLRRKNRNIHKAIGTHLATVTIEEDDGHITAPGANGHFSLYESHTADLSKKCHYLEALP